MKIRVNYRVDPQLKIQANFDVIPEMDRNALLKVTEDLYKSGYIQFHEKEFEDTPIVERNVTFVILNLSAWATLLTQINNLMVNHCKRTDEVLEAIKQIHNTIDNK